MVSEPVKNLVMEASSYLKQAEQMGNDPRVLDMCMACEGTLESINVFIHDEEPWDILNKKSKELNQMFHKEFENRKNKMKDKGAYIIFCEEKKIERELMIWKCEQKVTFYDFLTKKYDF